MAADERVAGAGRLSPTQSVAGCGRPGTWESSGSRMPEDQDCGSLCFSSLHASRCLSPPSPVSFSLDCSLFLVPSPPHLSQHSQPAKHRPASSTAPRKHTSIQCQPVRTLFRHPEASVQLSHPLSSRFVRIRQLFPSRGRHALRLSSSLYHPCSQRTTRSLSLGPATVFLPLRLG